MVEALHVPGVSATELIVVVVLTFIDTFARLDRVAIVNCPRDAS